MPWPESSELGKQLHFKCGCRHVWPSSLMVPIKLLRVWVLQRRALQEVWEIIILVEKMRSDFTNKIHTLYK